MFHSSSPGWGQEQLELHQTLRPSGRLSFKGGGGKGASPFLKGPQGEAPLVLAPLHSLSHGSRLSPLCTRQSPRFWPSSPLGLWSPCRVASQSFQRL